MVILNVRNERLKERIYYSFIISRMRLMLYLLALWAEARRLL